MLNVLAFRGRLGSTNLHIVATTSLPLYSSSPTPSCMLNLPTPPLKCRQVRMCFYLSFFVLWQKILFKPRHDNKGDKIFRVQWKTFVFYKLGRNENSLHSCTMLLVVPQKQLLFKWQSNVHMVSSEHLGVSCDRCCLDKCDDL